MAAVAAFAGPAMSLFGGAMGMFGGSNAPQVPTNPWLPYASSGAITDIQGMEGTTSPLAGTTLQNLYNDPNAAGAQAAAGTAGRMGQAGARTQFGTGYGLVGEGMGAIPYANMAMRAGFDPMGSVYNQQFQQFTDQTRAAEAARGIENTPYGAGVETQGDINFNNAWLMGQLGRMGAGASTYNTLMQGGVGTIQQGLQDIAGAPGQYYQGGALPYQTSQGIGQNQYGAITGYQGIQQQPIQDYLNFQQNATAQDQAASQAWARQQQAMQGYGMGIGAGIQGLSKAYGQYGNPFQQAGGAGNWGQQNPGAPGSSYYGPTPYG